MNIFLGVNKTNKQIKTTNKQMDKQTNKQITAHIHTAICESVSSLQKRNIVIHCDIKKHNYY